MKQLFKAKANHNHINKKLIYAFILYICLHINNINKYSRYLHLFAFEFIIDDCSTHCLIHIDIWLLRGLPWQWMWQVICIKCHLLLSLEHIFCCIYVYLSRVFAVTRSTLSVWLQLGEMWVLIQDEKKIKICRKETFL